jgi:hypothetical protein
VWRVVSDRYLGVEYFIKALSTGEFSAAERLAPYLADDVEFDTNSQPGVPPVEREQFRGKESVIKRVTGRWPVTWSFARLGWSDPSPLDDSLIVTTSSAITVTFEFNERDQIRRAFLDGGWGSNVQAPQVKSGSVEEIPLVIKGLVHDARSNDTPLIVTYVDEVGVPHSSFRGSVSVIGPAKLSIWVREADRGLAKAIESNPNITLVYSDMRSTFVVANFSGRASVSDDEEIRRKAYELSIEAEQNHDLGRTGVAVVVDVTAMQAYVGGRVEGVSFTLNRS